MTSGWLNLYKPVGMTSAQAVARVKRLVRPKKIGHAGTLDPLASGVLPLALNEATKSAQFVMLDTDKYYRFTVRFGEERETDDAEGKVVATSPVRPSKEAIEAILPQFTGEIMQVPPVYSAIKQGGKRACDRVRQGEEVVLPPRPIMVYNLLLIHYDGQDASFEVRCGKGTYIRSLGRDMARSLGSVGYISHLERQRVGQFLLEETISLEKLEELVHNAALDAWLIPIATVLDDIPAVAVSPDIAKKIRYGQRVVLSQHTASHKPTKVMCGDELVAVTTIHEGGVLQPMRIFNTQ